MTDWRTDYRAWMDEFGVTSIETIERDGKDTLRFTFDGVRSHAGSLEVSLLYANHEYTTEEIMDFAANTIERQAVKPRQTVR